MATVVDDRTDEQRQTHTVLIAGNDACLSGWGGAQRGTSIAIWACRPGDGETVERWVRGRSDMRRVRVVNDPPFVKRGDHAHIYVVNDGHPALGGE